MRRGEFVHIVDFAVRGAPSVEREPIPGRHALLHVFARHRGLRFDRQGAVPKALAEPVWAEEAAPEPGSDRCDGRILLRKLHRALKRAPAWRGEIADRG